MEEVNSSVAVRPGWLDRVTLESQIASGRLSFEDLDEAHATVTAFAKTLPAPASHVERLLLRGLILEFACRSGEAVHARAHGKTAVRCEFPPASLLKSLWHRPSVDPRRALVHWADAFFEALKARHRPTLAGRAARLIRKNYTRPCNSADLAEHFHVTPSQLRRAFKREFGMSMREYQQSLRLKAALPHVGTEKIDALALQVGYRSKKNFYRAFQKLTGQTLTAYRAQLMRHASNDASAKKKK